MSTATRPAGARRLSLARDGVPFRRAFLTTRRLPDAAYERALFFECASLQTLILALILEDPAIGGFPLERFLIDRLALARSMDDVLAALSSYQRRAAVRHGWMRRVARIGLSPRRLTRVAKECLPCADLRPVPFRRGP